MSYSLYIASYTTLSVLSEVTDFVCTLGRECALRPEGHGLAALNASAVLLVEGECESAAAMWYSQPPQFSTRERD